MLKPSRIIYDDAKQKSENPPVSIYIIILECCYVNKTRRNMKRSSQFLEAICCTNKTFALPIFLIFISSRKGRLEDDVKICFQTFERNDVDENVKRKNLVN